MISMLIIFLAATSWILGQSDGASVRNQLAKVTATSMAQAKEALIGRAATDDNRPGSLTCPDVDNDGLTDTFGGNCSAYIGRFPWKTLKLPELLDGNGDRLWYALSFELRDTAAAQPINSQKPLGLTLDGTPNIAAIVFSGGPPHTNQHGRPSNAVSDYLDDGGNNDGDNSYVSGPVSLTFNDKVLAITRDDIFRTVSQRILAEIRGPDDNAPGAPRYGLRRYYDINATFPWADGGNDGLGDVGMTTGNLPYNDLEMDPASLSWLIPNEWLSLVTYQHLSASSVRIAIGSSRMDITPCPSSPCPQ